MEGWKEKKKNDCGSVSCMYVWCVALMCHINSVAPWWSMNEQKSYHSKTEKWESDCIFPKAAYNHTVHTFRTEELKFGVNISETVGEIYNNFLCCNHTKNTINKSGFGFFLCGKAWTLYLHLAVAHIQLISTPGKHYIMANLQ